MTDLPLLDSEQLRVLAQGSAAVNNSGNNSGNNGDSDTSCACAAPALALTLAAWTSTPLSFPESQLKDIATLYVDPYDEPGFAEYHPDGTRYDSADAPIAPRYFPYNRCNVAACTLCGRCYLRYTEAGGYFVDRRIRALNRPELIVDAVLPA